MDKIDISIATKNKIAGKVSTKKKIDANIYPRGPKGEQGLQGLKGEKGDDGNGIVNIKKAKTEGLIDTYTILFSNGSTFNFTVTNANTEDIYSKEEIEELLNKKVNILDIVNELTSDDVNKTLSAAQGKILKGLIDSCYTSTETDNLLKSKANKEELNQLQSNIETAMGGKLSKIGDTMSGNLTMSNAVVKIANGREKGIQNASGMPIICDFDNQNVTVDATGKELFLGYRNTTGINFLNYKVAIDSNGNVAANNFTGKWNGYTDALPRLGTVANVLDTTITKGFGTYNASTSNIPSGFFKYGAVLFLPTASSSPNGHIVMLFGNNESANGRIAITYYVNGEFTGWNYIRTRNNITTGTEIATNEYLDNKQIYQKTIKITSLNSNKTYTHGISNFGELIDIYGTGYWSGQGWQPIQRVVTDNIGPYRAWAW
nr:MAG TPA: Pulmonary surfactant-associated protein D, c-type lectin, alpha-helical coiled [Caudoviricetes sp.]